MGASPTESQVAGKGDDQKDADVVALAIRQAKFDRLVDAVAGILTIIVAGVCFWKNIDAAGYVAMGAAALNLVATSRSAHLLQNISLLKRFVPAAESGATTVAATKQAEAEPHPDSDSGPTTEYRRFTDRDKEALLAEFNRFLSGIEALPPWPLEQVEEYVQKGVEIGDLTPHQAERAVSSIRAVCQEIGRRTQDPDASTNEWGHTVLFWAPPGKLAELRIRPEAFDALVSEGDRLLETESDDPREAARWLYEHAEFIRR